MPDTHIRKGQGSVTLTREEFERRLRQRFDDPLFDSLDHHIAPLIEAAWSAYIKWVGGNAQVVGGRELRSNGRGSFSIPDGARQAT